MTDSHPMNFLPDLMKSAQAYEEYLQLLNTEPPKKLEAYPNPSDDYVIVSYKLDMERKGSVIEISNLNGITIEVIEITNQVNQVVLNTHN